MWPQIIFLVLFVGGTLLQCAKHGEEREPYHGGWAFAGFLINIALLYWGGFFAPLFR